MSHIWLFSLLTLVFITRIKAFEPSEITMKFENVLVLSIYTQPMKRDLVLFLNLNLVSTGVYIQWSLRNDNLTDLLRKKTSKELAFLRFL